MSVQIVPWISPSALAAFSTCRQQWRWSYVDGYRSMGRSFIFDVGTGIHIALAAMYRDEADPVTAFNDWIDEQLAKTQEYMDVGGEDIARALASDLDSLEEARKLGTSMLKQYVKAFQSDRLEVLAVEQRLERPIPGTDWMLPAIIDVLVRNHARRRKIYVMEHKTFSRFEEWYLYKDHQFVAEAWVAETITDGEPVAGVLYNGLRKAFPERTKQNLFERRVIDVNESQVRFLLKRLRGMHRTLTTGKLAIYPEPSMGSCRYCPFKEPCDLMLRGDDYQEYLDLMYVKRGDE